MNRKIYNIPLTSSFADAVAERFLAEYKESPLELADVLFLLPNRRAVKTLSDAFVRVQGMVPTLLPKMLPIGDVEEDELFLTGTGKNQALLDLLPAIDRTERLLLFTKIIMAKPADFGLEKMPLSQACSLAQELAGLIDTVNNENLSFDNLKNLVPEEYAAHWQETLKFLEIITRFWPSILQERGLLDPSLRRNLLLAAQCEQWKKNPPDKRIVTAGTTATFAAMKELVKTVLSLPQGEVILSGLDKYLDDDDWEVIDETHPQFELKELLDYLQISRSEVQDMVMPQNEMREKFVSEVMRPAKTTDKWRGICKKEMYPEAWQGISLIDCADIREEALTIALLMREVLETPERTAALVTSDRNLARRVASELERWKIKVDDSAGRPLSLTPAGAFLRLVVKVCAGGFERADLLCLLKHPFTAAGCAYADIRRKTRALEQVVWRSGKEDADLEAFEIFIKEKMRCLYELFLQPQADFKELIRCHVKTAELLAETPEQSGEQILWKGEAGEAAAQFIADLYDKADVLGAVDVNEYSGLFEVMMSGIMVRPKYGTHPRLKILGPIEARLNRFDVTIIGEVNEGIWPKQASSDPWMSRPMKKDFGFPMPEKAIGVMGLDFCQLLGGDEVYLTRAERVQGTPMVKSRWWMRLETVLKALEVKIESLEDVIYRLTAKKLDEPETFVRIAAPEPRPPVAARPRELSASAVEMWMRDPYSVFAKYILRLKPLDEINRELNVADYGNIVHAVLEEFNNEYSSAFPENAREILIALGHKHFANNNIGTEIRAFWWPNFEKTVDWIVQKEKAYRSDIRQVHNEVKGRMALAAPAGDFVLTAKADRIDETDDGRVNVIDYKTGKARSVKEVEKGFAPQLPIEGLIAQAGGFEGIKAREVAKLIYWQPAKKETVIEQNMSEILERNLRQLSELINLFDFETTAYICRPNPKRVPEYSDYEHLARVREWSVFGDEEE